MDAMTIPDVWSGQDRALTVEDMENMPDDEFRYELDDGVLIVSPAPSTLHQLDRRAVQQPSRADRLRASFGHIRTDRSCHRRRGVPRRGPVPGHHRAVPARTPGLTGGWDAAPDEVAQLAGDAAVGVEVRVEDRHFQAAGAGPREQALQQLSRFIPAQTALVAVVDGRHDGVIEHIHVEVHPETLQLRLGHGSQRTV